MNIAIITPNYPKFEGDGSGTAGLFIEDFAKSLRKNGNAVFIFTQKIKGAKNDDPDVIRFEWRGGRKDDKLSSLKISNPKTVFLFYNLVKKGKQELIKLIKAHSIMHCICMWAVPSGIYAMHAMEKLGTKFSVWTLGADILTYPRYPIFRGIIKKVLVNAEFLYADGEKLAEDVQGLSHKRCGFLPSSRDLRSAKESRLGLDKTKKHFLFVGRYERAKGPDILVDAIKLINAETKNNFMFHFFGGGTMKYELRRKIRKYRLQHVKLNGFIDKGPLKAYLQQVDFLIIPSRIDSIPVILSDAMQMNCPVIATDVGDTGTLVRKYNAGIVVPSENSNLLAEAILTASEKIRAEYKKNTNELFEAFDINKVAKRYHDKIQSGDNRLMFGQPPKIIRQGF